MYKHFSDKKLSNKIKLGRVNSKLTNDQLREIRQSAINSLYESQRHLKEAVLKSLEAYNIDPKEEGIENTVTFLIYSKPWVYNDLFNFVRHTLGKLETKIY
jgi:hypothetical protein